MATTPTPPKSTSEGILERGFEKLEEIKDSNRTEIRDRRSAHLKMLKGLAELADLAETVKEIEALSERNQFKTFTSDEAPAIKKMQSSISKKIKEKIDNLLTIKVKRDVTKEADDIRKKVGDLNSIVYNNLLNPDIKKAAEEYIEAIKTQVTKAQDRLRIQEEPKKEEVKATPPVVATVGVAPDSRDSKRAAGKLAAAMPSATANTTVGSTATPNLAPLAGAVNAPGVVGVTRAVGASGVAAAAGVTPNATKIGGAVPVPSSTGNAISEMTAATMASPVTMVGEGPAPAPSSVGTAATVVPPLTARTGTITPAADAGATVVKQGEAVATSAITAEKKDATGTATRIAIAANRVVMGGAGTPPVTDKTIEKGTIPTTSVAIGTTNEASKADSAKLDGTEVDTSIKMSDMTVAEETIKDPSQKVFVKEEQPTELKSATGLQVTAYKEFVKKTVREKLSTVPTVDVKFENEAAFPEYRIKTIGAIKEAYGEEVAKSTQLTRNEATKTVSIAATGWETDLDRALHAAVIAAKLSGDSRPQIKNCENNPEAALKLYLFARAEGLEPYMDPETRKKVEGARDQNIHIGIEKTTYTEVLRKADEEKDPKKLVEYIESLRKKGPSSH